MGTLLDLASLVMIPSGVKEDKLYSVKPTDGSGDFTFSRNSDIQATRVNSSGLIEKANVNLLLQSNTFDTTWVSPTLTKTSGQSGYDGSSDAWLLDISSGTSNQRIEQSISASGVITLSVYAKAGSLDWIRLRGDAPAVSEAYFDLSTGSLGSLVGAAIDSAIESVGGGWYRCSVSFVDATIVRIYLATDDLDPNQSSGNIYIQDAQLNYGLIAQDYVETTTTSVVEGITADLPRLDYSGGASCPSLLLEGSRTNNVTHSEYIAGGVTWSSGNSMTSENNSIQSPEGVQNATKIIRPNNTSPAYLASLNIGASDANLALSCFAKAGDSDIFNITYYDQTTGDLFFNFDLSDGTIDSEPTGSAYYVDAGIEPMGDGWYRCYVVVDSQLTTGQFQIAVGVDRIGTANGYVYAYGAQLEEGSYPTSYIPTYGAAANRGADDCEKTGISSLIGQSEGTLFIELDNVDELDVPEITLDDGTNNNRIVLTRSFTGYWSLFTASAGSGSSTSSAVISNNGKFAIAYNATNYVVYKDGALLLTRTASLPASLTDFRFNGRVTDDFYGNKSIKQALLFKTRLSNTELAALTTI